MRRNILLSLSLVALTTVGPVRAAAPAANGATDCRTEGQSQRQQVHKGKVPDSAAEPESAASEKCSTDKANAHADMWMLGILMLGGLIIGVPAVRRRSVRVVFS